MVSQAIAYAVTSSIVVETSWKRRLIAHCSLIFVVKSFPHPCASCSLSRSASGFFVLRSLAMAIPRVATDLDAMNYLSIIVEGRSSQFLGRRHLDQRQVDVDGIVFDRNACVTPPSSASWPTPPSQAHRIFSSCSIALPQRKAQKAPHDRRQSCASVPPCKAA